MGRWQPGAPERLQRAAVELFLERGFEQTTVPQITERAGLTTRTFFRHFSDKREVLFAGDGEVPQLAADLVARAPQTLAPIDTICWGLPAMAGAFQGRADELRSRRTVIASDPGLQERELRKLAEVAAFIAGAFRQRGVDPVTAALAGDLAVSVFRTSMQRWLDQDGSDLSAILERTTAALRALPGGQPAAVL